MIKSGKYTYEFGVKRTNKFWNLEIIDFYSPLRLIDFIL